MRICFLADARSIHIHRWIKYFKNRGNETFLVTLEKAPAQNGSIFQIKPVIDKDFLKYLFSFPKVKKLISQIRPDLINAHFVPNYGLLGLISKSGKPMVITCWGSDILTSPQRSFLHLRRARWVLKRADMITSDSEIITEKLYQFGIPEEKIITVPMGVEEELFGKQSKKYPKETYTIISTRQHEKIYNLELLIYSIPYIVREKSQNVKFIISGTGGLSKKLQELSVSKNITEKVEFPGFLTRENYLKQLYQADIYVSTSFSDSTSVCLLEAMAAGLAPVVSDIPGNRVWIKDGENGLLFNPKDARQLADKILFLVQNPDLITSWAQTNQKLIKEKALWKNNMQVIEKKFQELKESFYK